MATHEGWSENQKTEEPKKRTNERLKFNLVTTNSPENIVLSQNNFLYNSLRVNMKFETKIFSFHTLCKIKKNKILQKPCDPID